MKKFFALLFVGTMITFAACQSKPKTEESSVDSTATMSMDSAAMSMDSTSTMGADTAAIVVPTDSVK